MKHNESSIKKVEIGNMTIFMENNYYYISDNSNKYFIDEKDFYMLKSLALDKRLKLLLNSYNEIFGI